MKRDADYKGMYLLLFSAVENAIDILNGGNQENLSLLALSRLINGQQSCEDLYVRSTEEHNLRYMPLQELKSTASST